MTQVGVVEWVETRPARTFLTADAAISDPTINVADGTVFATDDLPGSAQLSDGTVVSYDSWDDTSITLSSPLTVASSDGEPIDVYPAREVKWAGVNFGATDEWSEAIAVKVPHSSKWFTVLQDGIYDGAEQTPVEVERDAQPPYLVDVINQLALYDGSYIDPSSTIPPGALTDGIAPASSPMPTLEPFAVGGLRWSVTPVANADPVKFRVYADTVDPPTIDAAHLVADTAATSGSFASINGVALLPGDPAVDPDPIYVACIEYDADGDAPTSATSTAASPRRATSGDIAANYVYAGTVQANQIEAGSFEADVAMVSRMSVGNYTVLDGTTGSITIYADAEHTQPLVQLDPAGSVFRGQVIADDVSVLNGLILQGTASHVAQNAGLTLDNTINDPGGFPVLSATPATMTWPANPTSYSTRGISWDGSNFRRLIAKSDGFTKVQTINTSGAVTATVTLDPVPDPLGDSNIYVYMNSIVKIGSYFYCQGLASDENWRVYKFNASTGAYAAASAPLSVFVTYRPCVGTDGTNVLATDANSGLVFVLDPTTLASTGGFSFSAMSSHHIFVGRQNFDFGANRVVLAAGSTVHSYTVSGSTMTEQTAENFTLPSDASGGGVAWDGTNFFSTHGAALLNKYNGHYPAAGELAWVSYADTDTGTSKHTKDSPRQETNIPARFYLQVALPPAPSGAATPRVYMALASSSPADTALLLRSETITARNLLIDPSVSGGIALVRTANVSTRARTGGVATLVLTAAHNLEVGDSITVASINSNYNGTFTVASVPNSTTITYSGAAAGTETTTSSAGTITNTDTNTFGTGTPAWIKSQTGGLELYGDGTGKWPLLGHSDSKTLGTAASPTGTTNVDMNDLDMSVTVQSTSDVVWVDIDAVVGILTANATNIIELLVDGVADAKQILTRSADTLHRVSAYKKWRLTGLSAGSHTLEFRTRSGAASNNTTVLATHTSASYWTNS